MHRPEAEFPTARCPGGGGDVRLRVLAVHRYFWPDAPPYASILRSIVARWAADGHQVEVLSTQPSYKPNARYPSRSRRERIDGILVRRIRLPREHGNPPIRLFNVLVFCMEVVRTILVGRRYDIVMTSTAPPVALAWAASLAARIRGSRFIYHCMDIHPEIGRVSGDFSNPVTFSVLRRADLSTCRRSWKVVVLSQDMANALQDRAPGDLYTTAVINNFELTGDDSLSDGPPPIALTDGTHKRIVFTGNVGRFQGLPTVLEALDQLNQAKVELVVMGDGTARPELEAQARRTEANVTFVPHQSAAAARAVVRTADLCLVSLTHGIHQFAYPSKTMTYLAEGKPLLVVMEPNSELARLVRARGIGLAAPPTDPRVLATELDGLLCDEERLKVMSDTARAEGPHLFSKARTLDRWSDLLRCGEGIKGS